MAKQILQIEITSGKDFKNEIIKGISEVFTQSKKQLQHVADEDILLDREATAKLLSVSLVTLWDWTKKDILPAYRIGYKVRYKKNEVLKALKKMNQFDDKDEKSV